MGGGEQGADGGSRAAGTGGEGVAGMNELMLDVQAEMADLVVIDGLIYRLQHTTEGGDDEY